jgi:hypothetical protein
VPEVLEVQCRRCWRCSAEGAEGAVLKVPGCCRLAAHRATLRRLKLGRLLDTLPDRLVLARQQKMPHQDFLLLLLADEVSRHDSLGVALHAQRARLDPMMHLEAWDPPPRSPSTGRSSMSWPRCASSTATRMSPSTGPSAPARPSSLRPRPHRVSPGGRRPRRAHRSTAQDPHACPARQQLRSRIAQGDRGRPPRPRLMVRPQ